PLSILLIFLLLLRAFHSARSALLILANIPFALSGGAVALFLTGTNLSVSAYVGFIALIGQAVLNGVLLVSDINARSDAGTPVAGSRENVLRKSFWSGSSVPNFCASAIA